jgi:hypothetical protein
VEGEKVEVRPKILARTTTGFQTTNLTTFVDDEGGDVVVRALLCDWKPQSPHSDVNGCLFQFTKVSAGSTQQSRPRQLRIAGEPARLDPAARASRRR